jgi:hypothetical protein
LAVLAAASVEREKDLYVDGSPIKKQGREKRPRLGSKRDSRDEDEQEVEFIENEIAAEAAEEHEVAMEEEAEADVSRVEEGDSMVSFRFPAGPAVVSPKMIRKAHSHQPQAMVSSLAVGIPMSTSVSMDGRAEDVDAGDEFGSERDMDEVDSEEEDKENRRDTPVPVSASASMMMSKSFQQTESDSLGNDTQETTRSPAKQSQDVSVVTNESEFDDDENVQELIIPPTLPNTNLSATFPTSATTKTSFGTVNLSPITAGGKPRRAPIPLDFKHPTATAPAGLFKALVQNVVAQNNAAKEGVFLFLLFLLSLLLTVCCALFSCQWCPKSCAQRRSYSGCRTLTDELKGNLRDAPYEPAITGRHERRKDLGHWHLFVEVYCQRHRRQQEYPSPQLHRHRRKPRAKRH